MAYCTTKIRTGVYVIITIISITVITVITVILFLLDSHFRLISPSCQVDTFLLKEETPSYEVVISHYNEDLDWVHKLPSIGFPKYIILSKTIEPIYIHVNKGNEASIFLKYICDHYNHLQDFTIFLHGHEFAWHQEGSILDLLRVKWNKIHQENLEYVSLNRGDYLLGSIHDNEHFPTLRDWYDKYLKEEMGPIEHHGDWTVDRSCCSQFIVHKKAIQRRSLQCYQTLLDWILTTELDNATSGRFLEWTWELLWEVKK